MTVHAPRLHFLSDDEQLYFLHIQKTAGTTFTAMLEERFDPAQVCPAVFLPDFLKIPEAQRKNYHLYRGHLSYNLHLLLDRKPTYITMLRDPIARVISNLDHIKRYPEHRDHAFYNQVDLLTFVRDERTWSEMRNLQTRMIAPPDDMVVDIEKYWPETEADLERAKARLHEFPFFGFAERFDDSMALLAYTFGWRPYLPAPQLNAAPRRTRRDELPRDVLEAITELNQLDIALYEYAQTLFQERYAQMMFHLNDLHYREHYAETAVYNGGKVIKVDFSKPMPGENWYPYEETDRGFRWTGPEAVSTVDVMLARDMFYMVSFHVVAGVSDEVLATLRLLVNDQPVPLNVIDDMRGGKTFYGVLLPSQLQHNHRMTRLSLAVDHTEIPAETGAGDDPRALGVAVSTFEVRLLQPEMPEIVMQ